MKNVVLATALAVAVSGCATITRGTNQDFTVESTPSGATVSTSNGFECPATPCTFRMPRKDGFTVDLTLNGYLPARETVTSNMSSGGAAGMAGNVLVGGLIGVGVDATSGALNDLSPNPLQVTLIPVPVEAPVADAVAAAPADAATATLTAAPVEAAAAEPAPAAAPTTP
ncbi:PEGA domain-containing protein [Vitreimonas flagellata]|uniref:PEGA domain-containing protein n=1 Tax=Vitreimonas flagellata TaxID=2560861 RepID=UPI001074CAF3|nr:PEGA domain-containing protein [Vitreimonas flagellata]